MKINEPMKMWKALHSESGFGNDYFLGIIEEQYAGRFAANYDALYNHVECL